MDAPPDQGLTPPSEPSPPAPDPAPGAPNADERQWAMLCHLGGIVGHLLVGFGHIVAPLVMWLIRREKMPFVNQEGKEAVNFQISITIYAIASWALVTFCIGIPMLIALGIFDLVVVIMACIDASNGKGYRYPLCIRFIQ